MLMKFIFVAVLVAAHHDVRAENNAPAPALKALDYSQALSARTGFNALQIADKSYLISTFVRASWYGAQGICSAFGKTLASIASEDENESLRRAIYDSGAPTNVNYWLSGNDLTATNNWTWLRTGRALRYTNWATGQPNNVNRNQHCLEFWPDGKWNDFYCSSQNFFICEDASDVTDGFVTTGP